MRIFHWSKHVACYGKPTGLLLDRNSDIILQAHKVCIEKYLHPKEVQKAVKCLAGESILAPKRAKRSEVPKFSFQLNRMPSRYKGAKLIKFECNSLVNNIIVAG